MDSCGNSFIIHYNGSSPTGFRISNYTEMKSNWSNFLSSPINTTSNKNKYFPLVTIINATFGNLNYPPGYGIDSQNVTKKMIDLYN